MSYGLHLACTTFVARSLSEATYFLCFGLWGIFEGSWGFVLSLGAILWNSASSVCNCDYEKRVSCSSRCTAQHR